MLADAIMLVVAAFLIVAVIPGALLLGVFGAVLVYDGALAVLECLDWLLRKIRGC